jgi:tetratricopeptide (TPR) repeat protein
VSSTSTPEQILRTAVSHHQAGDVTEAARLYRHVLEHDPNQADALNLLGVIVQQAGDLDQALHLFDQASAAAPGLATVPFNKANALRGADREEEALAAYKTALDINPEYADARLNLGALLHDRGNTQAAIAQFNNLLKAAPGHAKGHYNLGKCRQTQGRLDDAQVALTKAIELDANDADAHFALANVLADLGKFEQAIAQIKIAINLRPNWPEANTNWANYLCELDLQEDALEKYEHALTLSPSNANATVNKAFALLSLGKLHDGWDCYKVRHESSAPGFASLNNSIPMWQGESLSDKRVLVLGEQGLGDEILYASMLQEFSRETRQCILACSTKLVPLFKKTFAIGSNIEIVDRKKDDLSGDQFDVQTTFIDIGKHCRPSLRSFPPAVQYLAADREQVASLRDTYQAQFGKNKVLVGISWASGNPTIGRNKSIPLENWSPVLEHQDLQFISLQTGQACGDLETAQADIRQAVYTDPNLPIEGDIQSALCQLAVMDLVITCSNTTAHLSGASGRPTWVVLPTGRSRIWYWFKGQNPCPWYPQVRLYQKSTAASWRAIMGQVGEDLGQLPDRSDI